MKKSLLIMAMGLASASAFAVSSGYGIDDAGQGAVQMHFTAVGSCTAPTVNLSLGDIDFHTQANGPTGVYQTNVPLTITCTNPGQHWAITNQTRTIVFNSGISGANTETGYVSLSTSVPQPGSLFYDTATLGSIQSQFSSVAGPIISQGQSEGWSFEQTAQAVLPYSIFGVGTTTANGKLTFGKNLPAGAVADVDVAFSPEDMGGVPSGTIDGRGAFSVDVPLVITY
jgi:hypothetical protein